MVIVGILMVKEKVKEIGLNCKPAARSFSDMSIVEIDLNNEQYNQCKFDVLIHNMSDFLSPEKDVVLKECAERFYNILRKNKHIICIDPVESIRKIFSRYEQLRLARRSLESSNIADRAYVPQFCLLETNDLGENLLKLEENNLSFPIICKPTRAQGDGAHDMAVVFNEDGLQEVKYPVVAQQFINHNASLFKISVVADHVFTTKRPSIKNMRVSGQRPLFFHTFVVSKDGYNSPLTKLDPNDKLGCINPEEDELLFQQIATNIRRDFQLDLFSVDVIECVETVSRPHSAGYNTNGHRPCKFAVIDVNPLPSYKNVPNFHHHLGNLIRKKLSLPIIPLKEISTAPSHPPPSESKHSNY